MKSETPKEVTARVAVVLPHLPPSPPLCPPPFPRWVREMYAFSIAAALVDMPLDLPRKPRAIMSQVG